MGVLPQPPTPRPPRFLSGLSAYHSVSRLFNSIAIESPNVEGGQEADKNDGGGLEEARKGGFPMENPGKSGESLDLGSGGGLGDNFLLILKKEWPESSVELFCFILDK